MIGCSSLAFLSLPHLEGSWAGLFIVTYKARFHHTDNDTDTNTDTDTGTNTDIPAYLPVAPAKVTLQAHGAARLSEGYKGGCGFVSCH